MESFSRIVREAAGSELVLEQLKEKQQQYSEGSSRWRELQDAINQITAQRFLEYVNR